MKCCYSTVNFADIVEGDHLKTFYLMCRRSTHVKFYKLVALKRLSSQDKDCGSVVNVSQPASMDAEEIRDYCLAKENVTEGFPFGPSALVFKTAGKMFLLMMIDEVPLSINLKCNPEKALELREMYQWVLPGYHMNKKHWNTVLVEPALPSNLLKEWIDDSYNLVRPKRSKDKAAPKHNK